MDGFSVSDIHGSSSTANLISEIRKPSKIRVVVFVLLIVLLVLSIAFIALYVREKTTETQAKGKMVCG